VLAPVPPAPEARFRVISASEAREIAQARRDLSGCNNLFCSDCCNARIGASWRRAFVNWKRFRKPIRIQAWPRIYSRKFKSEARRRFNTKPAQ